MQRLVIPYCLLAFGLALASQPAPPPISLRSLLHETTDLAALTELPSTAFTTHTVSSRDRASVTPLDAADWFANHDRGHSLYEGTLDKDTPFFRTPPQRRSTPDGQFPAGTKIGLAPHRRVVPGYVWAYTTDLDGKPDPAKRLQGYIRQEAWTKNPAGQVLADITGPGCLTRLWSSNPGEAGTVRIFLDDQPTPAIEAKLLDLLAGRWQVDHEGKKVTPIPSPFAGERARGYTLIFPIPFARRCVVTVERPALQYQITYRRYPPGTNIESFRLDGCLKHFAENQKLAQALTTLSPPEPIERSRTFAGLKADQEADVQIATLEKPILPPGETRRLDLLQPPEKALSRAIIQLRCQVQADSLADALRTITLTITFDAADRSQVRVPLGDFFGTAPGASSFTTQPTRATAGGQLTAHWVMPYARTARLELTNLGTQQATVQLEAIHVPRLFTPRSLHFHAAWRSETIPTRPFQDWTIAKITGEGHYVGTALSVFNPVKDWWGEGDTKVWIDGEAFPSHWGTGTDDDFGMGWADRTLFSHAWHAQSRRDGIGHQGFTSLFRARLLDRLSFTKSLHLAVEVRHDQAGQRVQYAATSYWYARPGSNDDAPALTAESLRQTLGGGSP
jgi:hypothetical protein